MQTESLLTCIVCMQIVLAVLAIWKLRKGVEDRTLSATPAYDYNESRMSVPSAAVTDYNERDSRFMPRPFDTTAPGPASTATTESPAY